MVGTDKERAESGTEQRQKRGLLDVRGPTLLQSRKHIIIVCLITMYDFIVLCVLKVFRVKWSREGMIGEKPNRLKN